MEPVSVQRMSFVLRGKNHRMTLRRVCGVGAVVTMVMVSCLAPTQISVRITTSLPCSPISVELRVGAPTTIDGEYAQNTSLPQQCLTPGDPNYIGTIVITPGPSDTVT